MHAHPSRQAGATLLEAMIALALTAFGLLGLATLQASLQTQVDLSRQQAEALQLARGALEDARRIDAVDVAAEDNPIGARLQREVHAHPWLALQSIHQHLDWQDRLGQPRRLSLQGAATALPPALSGALMLGAAGWPGARIGHRHGAIPPAAHDLGDGRSVFQPVPGVAWIFDHASGDVVGICQDLPADASLDAATLAACARNVRAQWIGGFVQFTDGAPRNLDFTLNLSSSGHPAPGAACVDDAPATVAAATLKQVVRYHCLVQANDLGRWSGRVEIVPRAFVDGPDGTQAAWSDAPGGLRVCRVGGAPTGGQSAVNAPSPATYLDVTGALTQQNFLIVPSAQPCPVGTVVAA